MGLALDIVVILVLVLLNGLLAMSELAIVSSRRPRLEAMVRQGVRGASSALSLSAEPARFLPTVQVGITLVGVLAGAFGGVNIAERMAEWLRPLPVVGGVHAGAVALGVVVVTITYLSLVIGELVPKQLALRRPEALAVLVAPALGALAVAAGPLVWVLSVSSAAVLRLFGRGMGPSPAVTEEEVKALVQAGALAGVLEAEERQMIERVMRLPDKTVRAIMTPRTDVVWLDRADTPAETIGRIRAAPHSRFLVADGRVDHVLGVVAAKDLLDAALGGRPFDLAASMTPAPVFPDSMSALDALGKLRQSPLGLALVVDEYGSFEGIVTAADCLEAIVGQLGEEGVGEEPQCLQREDGSWLIDGMLPADEMAARLGVLDPLPDWGSYHTVGGFVLNRLRRVPRAGDKLVWGGLRVEVVDMDGRRVDKVLVRAEEPPPAEV